MNKFVMVEKGLLEKGMKGNELRLFMMMLDRYNLSEKNNWKDENGCTYIIMRRNEICEKLSISKRTASSLLNNLEEAALITRKKQGLGKPNLIYVTYQAAQCKSNIAQIKNDVNTIYEKSRIDSEKSYDPSHESCVSEEADSACPDMPNVDTDMARDFYMSWWEGFIARAETENETACREPVPAQKYQASDEKLKEVAGRLQSKVINERTEREPKKLHLKESKKLHFQKCKKLHLNNNTNYNNSYIYNNNTKPSYQSVPGTDDEDCYMKIKSTFLSNIDYNIIAGSVASAEALNAMADTVADILGKRRKSIYIAGALRSYDTVFRRLMELDSSHIEYVTDCIRETSVPIRNPKAYILSCLFNAPVTIDAYYALQANIDMNRQTYVA